MAQIIQGQPRQRRTDIPKPRHLREATDAAQAVGEILVRVHGQAEWILQIMEAVQNAVTNGVQRFTAAPVVGSNQLALGQGGGYQFPARTREELIDTTQVAAEERAIDPRSRFAQLHDPATSELGAPPPSAVSAPEGIIIPNGAQKPDDARPQQRHNDGPVQWVL